MGRAAQLPSQGQETRCPLIVFGTFSSGITLFRISRSQCGGCCGGCATEIESVLRMLIAANNHLSPVWGLIKLIEKYRESMWKGFFSWNLLGDVQ